MFEALTERFSLSGSVLRLTGAALTAVTAALLINRLRNQQNDQLLKPSLPPGPSGWPILGNLLAMDLKRVHETLVEFHSKYGPIISYRIGSRLFISISDYKMAKEMLDDPNFAGRPQLTVFQRQSRGCGIMFTEGTSWKQQRRLALKTMRDFGFAAARSEEMVNYQLDDILIDLAEASEKGRPVKVLDAFTEATNAVIGTLILGRKFKKGDPELEFVRQTAQKTFASRPLQDLPLLFPWTDKFVKMFPASNELNRLNEEMHRFIESQLQDRKRLKEGDSGLSEDAECLCDAYILEKRRAEDAGDFETFKDDQIIRVSLELFLAGTDTTARSLEWLLIYMAFEQDWQSKVQAEIDREIGNSSARRPTMQDRCKLHLTLAVIEETFRIVSLSSFALFHRAVNEDTEFHGYSIPSDALIVPFIYGISRDPSVWLRPNEFYPEHFLTPNGTYTGPGKNIPFSTGRRVCVGESLARMEVFLIFSGVLQRFRVRIADEYAEKKSEILRGRLGIFRMPEDYRLVFDAR